MSFDISNLLENWDYKPGQVVVRRLKGTDGMEKIQLRVDLGLLQMNAEGRPDGKRPFGFPTIYDYYISKKEEFRAATGDEAGFILNADDCSKLQLEAIQYHHRYICLLQLEDYQGVIRDTERNQVVFDFVNKFAASEELSWSLQQFLPQLLLLQTRARATLAVQEENYSKAIRDIQRGIEKIRGFYQEHDRPDLMEQSMELQSLQAWLQEVQENQPLTERERLEMILQEAVAREDYEKAAEVRDALKNLDGDNDH